MSKKEDAKDKPAATEQIDTSSSKDKPAEKKEEKEKGGLTEADIAILRRYGKGPYANAIKKVEDDVKDFNQKITTLCGIKESDTGLALPSQWNL